MCSISDTGDCHGYCRFPAFLWRPRQQQESEQTSDGWFSTTEELIGGGGGAAEDGAERRWFERTVQNAPGTSADIGPGPATWDSRREITARPTEIWTEQRVRTPCASAAAGGGGRLACYRRESTSNVSCLAEEPSGKYRVLVTDADG